jgi:hypothetical protein
VVVSVRHVGGSVRVVHGSKLSGGVAVGGDHSPGPSAGESFSQSVRPFMQFSGSASLPEF